MSDKEFERLLQEKAAFIAQHNEIRQQLSVLAEALQNYASHIQSINQKNILLASAIKEREDALKDEKARAQAILKQKQKEIAALREANETIRQTHERSLAQLASLEEKYSELVQTSVPLSAPARGEQSSDSKKFQDEISALRAENAELKAAETKKFLRMKEISNNFQLHMEKFERERYELEQKIIDLQQKSDDAAAQSRNASKNEFLAAERNKELERLLNNKTDECSQLQKKNWIVQKENEALKNKELEDAGTIKKRLKEVVGELKDFSQSLEKEKKELIAKNERLDKHLLEKEKELYEKEAETEVLKEQIKTLQQSLIAQKKESIKASKERSTSLQDTQDLTTETQEFLGLKSENQELRNLLEAGKKLNETLVENNKQLASELAQAKETIEKQKSGFGAVQAEQGDLAQAAELSKNERVMFEWYRSAFKKLNEEKDAAELENRGLKKEIENIREEIKELKQSTP